MLLFLLLLLLLLLCVALELSDHLELLLLRARLIFLVETVANVTIVDLCRALVAAARRDYRARRDEAGLRALAFALIGGAPALGLDRDFAIGAIGAAVRMRRAR